MRNISGAKIIILKGIEAVLMENQTGTSIELQLQAQLNSSEAQYFVHWNQWKNFHWLQQKQDLGLLS